MVLSGKGFNPMRWDCEKQGCFNVKRRPKIEVFHDCFPGRINFGDVDGIVEINGKGLMLEWKTSMKNLSFPLGQRIMYERLTSDYRLTVLSIIGDAETMDCQKYCIFFGGNQGKWIDAGLDEIKTRIKKWVSWAKSNQAVQPMPNGTG